MRNRGLGIALSYINTGINMILGLFLSAYLLRMLGDTEYGVYQTIGSFTNYLVLFEFGTGTVLTRNIAACRGCGAKNEEIEKNISTIWVISAVLSAVILLCSIVFYSTLDKIYVNSMTAEQISYGRRIFIFIVVYLIVSFYSQAMNGIVLAYEHYSVIPKVSIARLIVRTGLLTVLIFFFRYSILIAVVDMLLGIAITIYMWRYCTRRLKVRINFKHFDMRVLKASLPLCIAIFIQLIVNQANNNVDKFIIGIKLNPESVALYSVALFIYSGFSSLTTVPISIYAPSVVRSVIAGATGEQLTEELIPPSRLITMLGGLVLFGFVAVGQQFVSVVYGDAFLQAWTIAIIIMAPMLINMSNGVLINVLDAKDKRMSRSGILLITTIINIILTVLWIDRWGMVGAAIATAISTIIGQIMLLNIYYSRVLGIRVFHMYYQAFRGILQYQALGALLAVLLGKWIKDQYAALLICGALFVIISVGGYVLWGATESERVLIVKIVKRGIRRDD